MKSRLPKSCLILAGIAALLVSSARAEDSTSTIKFSDPARPGTVKLSLGRGELRIQGADTNEVTVKSGAKVATSTTRQDGLRVLSAAASIALAEKDNVVTVDAGGSDWSHGSNPDLRLTVPRNTTIVVQNAWGSIDCSGVSGDIEVNSMHGEIRLDEISGGVVAGTLNGEIRANIRELREGKPLSFTSMNGEVVVRLPESAKANVRLRTQNGSVLTDFDENALVTKTESSPGFPRTKIVTVGRNNKVLTAEIQDAIREATQLSATAVREALEAVKEGFEASRLDSDDARRQVEDARRQMDRARREADRQRRDAERSASRSAQPGDTSPAIPVAPLPPRAPLPTITGGKLVTGTLNGGGPEISVSTMNGDVTLRKLEAKK